MKKIAILGSTGSIGTQTLDVVRANKDIEVLGISAGRNIEKLEEQVAQLEEQMATPEGASDMKLYEQHQQLKKQIAEAEEEWTLLLSELEEMK